ncbi:uncharacterized protein T551_02844 [Pneumocystis jirovecii RU7]|uniref:ER membrane protein complex subunit 6 n=1 Tax=Pneumocystis jirovecii (strain RU7) TaxID=1408657 RepID=A0A0W4ZHP2_PNEJ7|nr:uncharacterized protein T551_02844 [Pneumocystis jirovecii RU7]KTW27877.1 hypothetical protein T551_02844 [Pneumocystis jirovecii RU7]
MDKKNHEIHAIASDAVAHNFKIISHIRSVTSIFFGFVAGILNLTSYCGLLFYVFGMLFVNFMIFLILTKRHPSLYFLSHKDIWTKDIFSGLLSFILSCTLSYGLVHIYI